MLHSWTTSFHSVYLTQCLDIIQLRSNHSFSTQYTRSVVAKYHRLTTYQILLSRREACVLLPVMSRSDKLADPHPIFVHQRANGVRLEQRQGADFQLFSGYFGTFLAIYSIFYGLLMIPQLFYLILVLCDRREPLFACFW